MNTQNRYPLPYAEQVFNKFYVKYVRATKFFFETWMFSKKHTVYLISTDNQKWHKCRETIKKLDSIIKTLPLGREYSRDVMEKCETYVKQFNQVDLKMYRRQLELALTSESSAL